MARRNSHWSSGLPASLDRRPPRSSSSRSLRIESPAFEGRGFGASAPMTASSRARRSRCRQPIRTTPIIVDLDRAPRNAQGLVEATADVEILRPTVAANGNRRLLYDVVNRGNQAGARLFQRCAGRQRFRQGRRCRQRLPDEPRLYGGVSGWQGDSARGGGRLTISVPVVPGITGISREEFIFDHMNNPAVATLTYPAADLDPAKATADGAPARDRSARRRRPISASSSTGRARFRSRGPPASMPARSTNSSITPRTRR